MCTKKEIFRQDDNEINYINTTYQKRIDCYINDYEDITTKKEVCYLYKEK